MNPERFWIGFDFRSQRSILILVTLLTYIFLSIDKADKKMYVNLTKVDKKMYVSVFYFNTDIY